MQKLILKTLILLSTIGFLNGHRFGLNFGRGFNTFNTQVRTNPVSVSANTLSFLLNQLLFGNGQRSNFGTFNTPFFNSNSSLLNSLLGLINFSTNPPTLRLTAGQIGLTNTGPQNFSSGAQLNVLPDGQVQLVSIAGGASPFTLLNASVNTQQPSAQVSSSIGNTSLSTGKQI